MPELTILNIGTYTHPERDISVRPDHSLSFSVSGMERMVINGVAVNPVGPFLFLGPKGTEVDFEYGKDRENRVVIFTSPHLRAAAQAERVEIQEGEDWVSLPMLIPISPATVPGLQLEWDRLQELTKSPIPANRLAVRLGVLRMLENFLRPGGAAEAAPSGPAAELKQRIDNDMVNGKSLAELSQGCRYSRDHLRALFRETYGMSPQAYRTRRRMALAMELVAGSRQSVKEIAHATGFDHVSHFSAVFHKSMGVSPSEAIKRYRYRSLTPEGTHHG
ncbi:MAG: helix-turn-helix domain-containing protein [Planctomycetota bacterium]|jgi:AraC-like DNA-binding protein